MKIPISNKGEIITFSDEGKGKEFIASTNALKELLKRMMSEGNLGHLKFLSVEEQQKC